jgi:hypothetical protein
MSKITKAANCPDRQTSEARLQFPILQIVPSGKTLRPLNGKIQISVYVSTQKSRHTSTNISQSFIGS